MEAIIKEITNAGTAFGSIILFAVLFWQQMALIKEFKSTIDSNTKATDALTAKIEQSMIIDQNVVSSMANCKHNQK